MIKQTILIFILISLIGCVQEEPTFRFEETPSKELFMNGNESAQLVLVPDTLSSDFRVFINCDDIIEMLYNPSKNIPDYTGILPSLGYNCMNFETDLKQNINLPYMLEKANYCIISKQKEYGKCTKEIEFENNYLNTSVTIGNITILAKTEEFYYKGKLLLDNLEIEIAIIEESYEGRYCVTPHDDVNITNLRTILRVESINNPELLLVKSSGEIYWKNSFLLNDTVVAKGFIGRARGNTCWYDGK